MNHEVMRYEQALKKQLRCTKSTRKYLLQQFQGSLKAYLDEHPSPSVADLCNAFGPPEEMAKVLMETVSTAEIEKYRKHTLFFKIVTAVLLTMILIQVIYSSFFKEYTIVADDSITEGTSATTDKEVGE